MMILPTLFLVRVDSAFLCSSVNEFKIVFFISAKNDISVLIGVVLHRRMLLVTWLEILVIRRHSRKPTSALPSSLTHTASAERTAHETH